MAESGKKGIKRLRSESGIGSSSSAKMVWCILFIELFLSGMMIMMDHIGGIV